MLTVLGAITFSPRIVRKTPRLAVQDSSWNQNGKSSYVLQFLFFNNLGHIIVSWQGFNLIMVSRQPYLNLNRGHNEAQPPVSGDVIRLQQNVPFFLIEQHFIHTSSQTQISFSRIYIFSSRQCDIFVHGFHSVLMTRVEQTSSIL